MNHLIHTSPHVAAFFLTGSDFLDGLISCFKIMNPPLRKVIIATTYLCLIGLTEGDSPKYSMLADQLYSLKAAADAHKAGPLNAKDSMIAELVTVTPILKQVQHRLEHSEIGPTRTKPVITALEGYRKPGTSIRPKRLIRRKIDKGKDVMVKDQVDVHGEMRVHRMSQVSQIQDLFPDLGSGFVSQLLDEYGDDTEQVIAHLLEDSLPPHLAGADRTKELFVVPYLFSTRFFANKVDRSPERTRRQSHDIAPRSTPPQIPTRHNVFDDDELDRLDVDISNLHFGKRNPGRTADNLLDDRSSAPNKAAILSALSAFDADDDERDDTYDVADAGFVVNDGHLEVVDDQKQQDSNEEALFRAYQADPKAFDRDAATRRSNGRAKLKHVTGMTDEAIEGWAVMLTRTPRQMKQLETKYSAFGGSQPSLAPTAWRARPAGSGPEDSDADLGAPSSRGPHDRGRGGGRGRGRGGGRGGNVAGPTGDKETENARKGKEAHKGSRANHNRRDQHAKKMNRGGFPG
jgi:activating signal cointegrator complex subunit 2